MLMASIRRNASTYQSASVVQCAPRHVPISPSRFIGENSLKLPPSLMVWQRGREDHLSEKILMKGNEALGEAAIRAGCRHYFAYPITPQSELPEYLAKFMPKAGGVFLQAESEVAAINMVYGAAGCGIRVMTSSSSPGISLKQEGISYIAGAELPCVIVNVMRAGPGLGSITPEQSDYFQATKGGGHGNYRLIVLAPNSVQEMADFMVLAFELADKYRNPAMVLGDGFLGQMMEPVVLPEPIEKKADHSAWSLAGCQGRGQHVITSIHIDPVELEEHNWKLDRKYKEITKNEIRHESYLMEDADYCIVAYGIVSRVAKSAIELARNKGIKVGMIRPKTLWPYPYQVITDACSKVKSFLVCELSTGQMIEDVRLAVEGRRPVSFFGRVGGGIMGPEDILTHIEKMVEEGRGK